MQCCNVKSLTRTPIDSSRYFQLLDSTRVQYENDSIRLESTAPKDSTGARLADFCRTWLESNQLRLVLNKFIKFILIVLLGKNSESCEQWQLRNIIRKYMGIWGVGICIKHIPDGHAFFISVFRNNGSATIIIFRMESQNVLCLY